MEGQRTSKPFNVGSSPTGEAKYLMSNSINDIIKEWGATVVAANEIFFRFKEQYKYTTGIVSFSNADWFGHTFIVLIDIENFIDNSLPSEYEGFLIQKYSVYDARDQMQNTLSQLMIETGKPVAYHSFNLNILNDLIKKYEEVK